MKAPYLSVHTGSDCEPPSLLATPVSPSPRFGYPAASPSRPTPSQLSKFGSVVMGEGKKKERENIWQEYLEYRKRLQMRDRTELSDKEVVEAKLKFRRNRGLFLAHDLNAPWRSVADLYSLKLEHNRQLRDWTYEGKVVTFQGEVGLQACLPNRSKMQMIKRESQSSRHLPHLFQSLPPIERGEVFSRQTQMLKDLGNLLKPKVVKKPKKEVVANKLQEEMRNLLGGPKVKPEAEKDEEEEKRKAMVELTGGEDEEDHRLVLLFVNHLWGVSCNLAKLNKKSSLKGLFGLIDDNGSGQITSSEFQAAFQTWFKELCFLRPEMLKVFRWMDVNREGSISFAEWMRLEPLMRIVAKEKMETGGGLEKMPSFVQTLHEEEATQQMSSTPEPRVVFNESRNLLDRFASEFYHRAKEAERLEEEEKERIKSVMKSVNSSVSLGGPLKVKKRTNS